MIVPSRKTSGFVAVTCPLVRSGSGVVKTSSVGRFGKCRRPSTVSKSAAHHVAVGRSPTVRLGSGPLELDRVEPPRGERLGVPPQRRHPLVPRARRVPLVQPEHVPELLPELLVRVVRFEVGVHSEPPARRADTGRSSSSSSAPRRASESPSRTGAGRDRRGPGRPRRAHPGRSRRSGSGARPRRSPSASNRAPYHGGTKSSVSGSACSIRARFTSGSKYWTSTKTAPRRYASAATARTSVSWPRNAPTASTWPG